MIKKLLNAQNSKIATAGSFVVQSGNAFFTFVNSSLIAKLMNSKEEYGIYIAALTVCMMLSIPTSLGLPMMISRNTSKYTVSGDESLIKGLVKTSNLAVLFFYSIVIALSVLLYFVWWKNLDERLVKTVWLSFILLFFISFGALRSSFLNGKKFVVLGAFPEKLLPNLLLFLFLLWSFIFNIKASPAKVMFANVVSTAIAFLLVQYFFYLKVYKELRKVIPKFNNKEWIKDTLPFTLNAGVYIFREKMSTLLLATFGGFSAVGIFDIASKAANLVSFTLTAINQGAAPFFSSIFEEKNHQKLQQLVTRVSQVAFLAATIASICFLLFGKQIIGFVFGPEYNDVILPLNILCLGHLVNALTGSVGMLLMMTGHQAYFARVNLIVTLFFVIIAIPMIIYLNVLGAAIATALMFVVQNIILYIATRKKLDIDTAIFNIK